MDLEVTRLPFTAEQLDAVADGRAFLARGGQPLNLKLRPKQRQQLEQAKLDGHLTLRGNPPDSPVGTLYREWCRLWNRPFIQIWPGRRWSSVIIDTFSCQTTLTPDAFDRLRRLLSERGRKRPNYHTNVYLGGREIPIEQAEEVAAGCFRIAGDPAALVGPLTIDGSVSPSPPSADAPTLDAYASRPGWEVWCVYCGDWHKHSPGEGHRLAHCFRESPYLQTGYVLHLAGPMTPEVRRRAWGQQAKLADAD